MRGIGGRALNPQRRNARILVLGRRTRDVSLVCVRTVLRRLIGASAVFRLRVVADALSRIVRIGVVIGPRVVAGPCVVAGALRGIVRIGVVIGRASRVAVGILVGRRRHRPGRAPPHRRPSSAPVPASAPSPSAGASASSEAEPSPAPADPTPTSDAPLPAGRPQLRRTRRPRTQSEPATRRRPCQGRFPLRPSCHQPRRRSAVPAIRPSPLSLSEIQPHPKNPVGQRPQQWARTPPASRLSQMRSLFLCPCSVRTFFPGRILRRTAPRISSQFRRASPRTARGLLQTARLPLKASSLQQYERSALSGTVKIPYSGNSPDPPCPIENQSKTPAQGPFPSSTARIRPRTACGAPARPARKPPRGRSRCPSWGKSATLGTHQKRRRMPTYPPSLQLHRIPNVRLGHPGRSEQTTGGAMQKFIAEESFWELFPRGGDRGGCRNRHEAHRGSAFRGQRGHRKAARRGQHAGRSPSHKQHHLAKRGRARVARGLPEVQDEKGRALLDREPAQARAQRKSRGVHHARRWTSTTPSRSNTRCPWAARTSTRSKATCAWASPRAATPSARSARTRTIHAGRRAVLSRRCGSRVPLLELARWPSHRPVRRFKERVSGDRMRRSNAPRRSGRGASRACPACRALPRRLRRNARHRRPRAP